MKKKSKKEKQKSMIIYDKPNEILDKSESNLEESISNIENTQKNLNRKQTLFTQEYIIDMNATQAALRAGYSKNTAYVVGPRLLDHVGVKKEIERLIALRAEKVGIDAEWVLKNLVDVANRCMQGIPVYDKEGKPTGEWRFEPNAANRSLELLGKHIGMFTDKIQTDNRTTIGFEESLLNLIKKRD